MNIVTIFEFMQKVWKSLVAVTGPFFEWLTTEMDIIDMTPFEFIFGAGVVLILVRAITRFIMGI